MHLSSSNDIRNTKLFFYKGVVESCGADPRIRPSPILHSFGGPDDRTVSSFSPGAGTSLRVTEST